MSAALQDPSSPPRRRIAAVDRLRALPAVFSTRQVASLFEISRPHADTMVAQWRARGFVKTLGERKAGVHFNLFSDPDGPNARLGDSLWLLLGAPFAGVGGVALNRGGWTTQLHRLHEACTGVTPRSPTVPTGLEGSGLRVLPRPAAWMGALLADAEAHGEESAGIPLVSPAMALADSLLARARRVGPSVNAPMPWTPDPDDVEIPGAGEMARVREALLAIGASPVEADDLLEPYEDSVSDEPGFPGP